MWQVTTEWNDIPIADADRRWDGDEARQRIFAWAGFDDDKPDPAKARQGFLLHDDERGDVRDGYKLPLCDVVDDALILVPRAIFAAAAALSGARGGVDVPDAVIEEAKRVVAALYDRLERPNPFTKTLKVVGPGRLRGYGVVFGGRDLEGETFTEETDFWFDKLALKDYPVLYDHGHHQWIGDAVIGRAAVHRDEVGIWLDIELSRAQEYQEYVTLVTGLAERGVLGLSSGAVAHLVKRAGSTITQWPIVEFSLTPTPAEPRTVGVGIVKAINPAMYRYIESKGAEAMLYATNSTTQSLNDFFIAVAKNDTEAIKAMSTKDLLETGSGGYLVPQQFVAELLKLDDTALGELLRRTMTIRNPTSNVINVPALNQAGSNGMYGGITVGIVGEGAAKPEYDPVFAQVQVQLYKLAGITQVSDELISDARIQLDQVLAQLFRNAMLSAAEQYLLTGTGTGQPLGILNSANTALVTVTRASGGISVANIAEMYARQMNPSNAVWIASPTVLPTLVTLNAGNIIAWMHDLSAPVPALIFGRPLIISQHAPALASAGALSFVDLSHVVTAMTDPSIQSSREYAFAQDVTTWRFVMRFGARPNVNAVIGSGADARSAFVQIGAA